MTLATEVVVDDTAPEEGAGVPPQPTEANAAAIIKKPSKACLFNDMLFDRDRMRHHGAEQIPLLVPFLG